MPKAYWQLNIELKIEPDLWLVVRCTISNWEWEKNGVGLLKPLRFWRIGRFAWYWHVPQVNGITHALESTFDVPIIFSAIILTLIVTAIILGGVQRISKIATIVVPFMAIGYVIAALSVILLNMEKVPQAIITIVHAAFNPQAALGGAVGFTVMQAIQLGVARGIFSNESGLGSAPSPPLPPKPKSRYVKA